MTIRKNKSKSVITDDILMQKVYSLSNEFRRVEAIYNEKINELGQKYISQHTRFKIGDTITLVNHPEGYTSFQISKILPDINWENGAVRLRAIGQMSGFEKETVEKTLFLDEVKNHFNPPIEVDTADESL